MNTPMILVGSCPAILLGALELAKHGKQVIIINPTSTWGGVFGGVTVMDRCFDIGMVLLETSAFNADPTAQLETYIQTVRNDCGRFVNHVARILESLAALNKVQQPSMFFRGGIWPDPVLSNNLEFLNAFSTEQKKRIAIELRTILFENNLEKHATNKSKYGLYDTLSYEEASLCNHGKTLHENFFGPLTQKILGTSSRNILARYHRVGWLPLYWPETLLEKLEGNFTPLIETNFVYPIIGNIAELLKSLLRQVESNSFITIIRDDIQLIKPGVLWKIHLKNRTTLESQHLVWGLTHGALCKAIDGTPEKSFEKSSLTLGFIRAPSDMVKTRFSTLFLPDTGASYRVTNQTISAGLDTPEHLMTIELNPVFIKNGWEVTQQLKLMREILFETGILVGNAKNINMEIKTFKNALLLPTVNNYKAFEQELQSCLNYSEYLTMVGPAGGFFTSSMNDQIIQGLKIGLTLGKL